jgi:hypothetical protein
MSTSDIREHVHTLVDQLPPAQLAAVEGLLSAIVDPVANSRANAPVDDELLTEEEGQAIRRSEAWFIENGGKGIPMEEVLGDFGLSMKDFPLEKHGG